MCYQMGWLKGQRLDKHVMKLKNQTEWFKLAGEECARLPLMVNDSSLVDVNGKYMTIGYMADDNMRILHAANCLYRPHSERCKKPTIEDWVIHLYPKCLLGGDQLTGAAGQVAWCFARACVTDGGLIKHGNECWPEGLPFD